MNAAPKGQKRHLSVVSGSMEAEYEDLPSDPKIAMAGETSECDYQQAVENSDYLEKLKKTWSDAATDREDSVAYAPLSGTHGPERTVNSDDERLFCEWAESIQRDLGQRDWSLLARMLTRSQFESGSASGDSESEAGLLNNMRYEDDSLEVADMDAKDEKLLDMRIAGLEQTFRDGFSHQAEVMRIQIDHLSTAVDASLTASEKARSELRESTRHWQNLLMGGMAIILGTMVALATLLGGFIWNLKSDVVNETTAIRKDLQQHTLEIQKLEDKGIKKK